jgi:hypothetical protein
VKEVILSPAERVEILLELGRMSGKRVVLRDRQSGAGILELRVGKPGRPDDVLPTRLTTLEVPSPAKAKRTRRFRLQTRGPGRLVINGAAMDPDVVNERIPLGNTRFGRWKMSVWVWGK